MELRPLEPGAFDAQGLRSIPPNVLIRKLAQLSAGQLEQVDAAVRRWLGQS